jgi:microcystin-dependent protein
VSLKNNRYSKHEKKNMKKILKSMILALLVSLTLTPAAHAGDQPYIGDVIIFAGGFAPRGWMFCDGRLLAISQHTALYSLLGNTYGGDGRTTFALPDLRDEGIAPDKNIYFGQYIIATQGIFPSRS